MAHPVNDGPVTILKVVTPGCYWIKCQSCSGSCRTPESIRQKLFSEDFYPPIGAKVLVHDEDGYFYQGNVCGRGGFPMFASMQARKYTVQLTHTFQVKDFDRCCIYPTFDEGSFTCNSAHLISLLAVLPAFPPPVFGSPRESNDIEACISFEDNVKNWDEYNYLVEDVIQSRRRFEYEHLRVINGSMYGKLSYFEKTREFNMKDFLASKKIGVITSFRFEAVVQSLMARNLHDCSNPLPMYSPNIPVVPPAVSLRTMVKKDPYNLERFKVHEEDLELHASLWTPFSSNILFTDFCGFRKGCVPVKYVAPDGTVVLGTVLSPDVVYFEMLERDKPPDYELKQYLRQQSLPCQPSAQFPAQCYNYSNIPYQEMPPSTDASSVSSVEIGLFDYEFDESLSQFKEQGGVLEEYISLPSLHQTSPTLLVAAEELFSNLEVFDLIDWQKVCLPSMLSRKNVLIIGPPSQRKMTTSIVSTLSLINEPSKETRQNSVSPVFVLFVDDYKRADEAAQLLNRLSRDLKVIITTYSQISEAQFQEIQLGCDVLISTPGNWLKLCGDLSCFNYSNLAHVVFESFEKLQKDYPSEVETIIEDLKLNKNVQLIFISNVWGSFLLDFVASVGTTTRCVIDILQACFCYRVAPVIVIAPENWEVLLETIILNNITTLRLLLCQDHREVADIKSRIDHLDDIFFVHENEDTNSVTEKIKLWKSNESAFLISSDIIFNELDFVQNVNLLVSWKQNPCSRSTLIRRFMAIRGHAANQRHKVPVYIFCSRDNLDELVLIKHVVENVKTPKFLGGTLDDCIKSKLKDRETLKLENHCTSFCMFGRCDQALSCPLRHKFRRQDLIHISEHRVFFKIALVKLHSAFQFTVRIEDVISNHATDDAIILSLKSKLSEIEMGLERAFRSGEMKSENFKVGDVVGALVSKDENIFRRVQIISVDDGDVDEGFHCVVSMLDFDEPCSDISATQLFPIPSEIASHPRDIVDIFLSKLLPVDLKANWVFETKHFLDNYVELVDKLVCDRFHSIIAGAVQVVINRSVVVDTIHWCRTDGTDDQAKYLAGISLKDVLLDSEYVKENPEHLSVLSELAIECGKQPFYEVIESRFGFRKNFPAGFHSGVVSAFDDPGLFYFQLSSEKENLEKLESSLNHSLDRYRRKLSVIVKYELCCVKNDGEWNRAIILEKEDATNSNNKTLVTLLFVDYGDLRLSVDANDLYCLPDEFLEIPYYAIECQLVSILPIDGSWSDANIVKFSSCIRHSDDSMVTLNLKFCGVVKENICTKHFRHQVVLQRPDDEDTVNMKLLLSANARWDNATIDLLIDRKKDQTRNPSLRMSTV